VAVIGAGYWGKKVIYEYLQLHRNDPSVNLSMVCDSQDQNLTYCREVYGLPSKGLTKDYWEVLDSQDINAVHICTPNETHYQIGKDALEAGKHVLLEKPMTLSSGHAYKLVETAKSSGLILQVGHIYRFNNALDEVRRLIREGYFGDIYYLKLQWTTLMNPFPDRNVIFDLAPHPIDILNYLLGGWPLRVSCWARAYRKRQREDVAYIMAEFDGHVLAQAELSWLQPGKIRQVSVVGSRRYATIDCLNQTIQVHDNHNGDVCNHNVEKNNTLLTEVSHFAECILNGEEYLNLGLLGARNVEVLECIRRSLRKGIVNVPKWKWAERALKTRSSGCSMK